MRFGDVQDTRKKESKTERKEGTMVCLEKHLRGLMLLGSGRRLATVSGVTFAF